MIAEEEFRRRMASIRASAEAAERARREAERLRTAEAARPAVEAQR